MIVRFLFASAVMAVVGGCAAARAPAVTTADSAVVMPELAPMTSLQDNVPLGFGEVASISAARGPGGPILFLHMPIGRFPNGPTVQDMTFLSQQIPARIYRFDMDGDGLMELALESSGFAPGGWAIVGAGGWAPDERPGYWRTWRVPAELFDPEDFDADLVLDFSMVD